MQSTQLIKLLVAILMTAFLSGCMNESNDDLEQFIRDAGKGMQVKIKPLPEVKTYLSFEFNADGDLSDPFKSRKSYTQSGILAPDLNRPKEPMETYPIESIKYVGMIEQANHAFALLQTPENNIQQIKLGNFVGQNFGLVTEIKESEVVIKEVIQDTTNGDWVEQISVITLQE